MFSASFLKHDTWVSDEAAVRQQLRRRFRFRLASDRFRRKSRDHDAGQSRSKEKLLYYKKIAVIELVGSFQFSVVVPTRDLCKFALSTVLPWQAFCRVRSGTGMLIK